MHDTNDIDSPYVNLLFKGVTAMALGTAGFNRAETLGTVVVLIMMLMLFHSDAPPTPDNIMRPEQDATRMLNQHGWP